MNYHMLAHNCAKAFLFSLEKLMSLDRMHSDVMGNAAVHQHMVPGLILSLGYVLCGDSHVLTVGFFSPLINAQQVNLL